ncbi:hypothetical protein [Paraburkholderia sp. J12]|uniref:hypothetical protein n=1 Tax=Paraburkholderia sp. J12 TaxID=2805432 RepID=UPI002ABD3DC0|nr:hypothetical protein [Paraburkholderia sp. J12]
MRASLILLGVALLGGGASMCPTPTPPAPVVKVINDSCAWVKPLSASASDTRETRQEIDAHDRAYVANCPKAALTR